LPVTTVSEFEAIASRIRIRIDKFLYERGEVTKVKDARRDLEHIERLARDSAKLKTQREKLNALAETIRIEIPHDEEVREMLWDLLDYIDYQI
jgi:hypothetical protein